MRLAAACSMASMARRDSINAWVDRKIDKFRPDYSLKKFTFTKAILAAKEGVGD